MKIKLISLSFIFFLITGNVLSQEAQELRDCIKVGLERNFTLLITKNSEAIARNNFTPGNAGFLPTIGLTGRQSGTLNNSKENLADGTTSSSSGEFNTISNAGVTLDLTIFNGFSVQTTYKKLNELKQLGELNTQLAIENLVADIVTGYYNCIQQVQLMNTLKYAVTLSKERLRIDEDRYLLGSGSKLQVLQSRVYLNADSSRLSKQLELLKASQIRLNELMAVDDLGRKVVLKDSSITINQELIYEKLLGETLAKNTNLLIASKDRKISQYDHKLTVSRSYPYLNLSSGYNYTFSTYSEGSLENRLTDGLNYGVTLGFNIFDGFNQRRNIRNSSIDVETKELKYLEIEQGVKADLITLYSAYSNYLRLLTLEEQNLQTATENLDIAMERYKLGNLSGIDLREVQKSLLDARESLLLVEYVTKLAEISLLLISGSIMDYYN